VFISWPLAKVTPFPEFRKFMLQEVSDVIVDQTGVDIMQDKDICQWSEEFEAETRSDPRLWSPGDEEFDLRNLFNQSSHDRKDGRLRLVVRALV